MSKQLILNADDFGRHSLINRAVAQGVEQGMLRSATAMVMGEAFEEAVAIAKAYPQLGVGIHFTLVNGRPVLPKEEIPSLIDPATREFYPNHGAFVKRFLSGKVHLEEVRKECEAQIEKFLSYGIVPTHGDSHQHMHVLPGIIDIVLDILRSHSINRLRIPAIPVSLAATHFSNLGDQVGRTGLHVLAERARKKAKAMGFAVPDHFGGIVAGEAVSTAALRTLILHLKPGSTEIMLHPGTDNKVLIPATEWDHDFQAELAGIVDENNRKLVDSEQVQVINFKNLKW